MAVPPGRQIGTRGDSRSRVATKQARTQGQQVPTQPAMLSQFSTVAHNIIATVRTTVRTLLHTKHILSDVKHSMYRNFKLITKNPIILELWGLKLTVLSSVDWQFKGTVKRVAGYKDGLELADF